MALVTFQRSDQLGEIVIDSPPLNLYSADLLADLRAAVDEAAKSDIRALLLRAEGNDFSAGADVSVFIGLDEAQASELSSTVVSLIAAIEDLPFPTLALIHGQCYAGALETCLACDLIWAAAGSQIGQIEAVAGSITYAGGTQRTTRAHAATKRMLHAWRSGGVVAADAVTRAEGPIIMRSQDVQEGLVSLQKDGPGHAIFNNR